MGTTYPKRRAAKEYEQYWVQEWKQNHTFEQSIENRDHKNSYVFYDGPPFITGLPHHGTLLSSIVKDAVPRFWTMNGKRVERRWGWDCHGLPAENFVEKQLNIEDRRQIGASEPIEKDGKQLPPISLEDYIIKARESMIANSESWEGTIDRIGRWVDFKNSYRTMDKDFMESVWWAFKQLYDQGKIYEGQKVLMYDTKFATPVSKAEVTMDNDAYQTVTDPSAYVKFKLKGQDKFMLAWTTTPWTLPANMAIAVNKDLTYVLLDNKYILAKKLAKSLFPEAKTIEEFKGSELKGLEYEPIFANLNSGFSNDNLDVLSKGLGLDAQHHHSIFEADFVGDDAGTGVVHIAPAYGEDDFSLALKESIPVVHVIDDNGYYYPEAAEQLHKIGVRDTDEAGIEVWAANKFIAKCLQNHDHQGRELTEQEAEQGKGIVWKIDYIRHEYPFNPRSKQRIMYRAIPSWFFDVQGSKPLLLSQNENINWVPAHLKHGRFAKNIEQAPDWTLSRNRFWATAMPVWKGDKGTIKVIGSYHELAVLFGQTLTDYHRPWVDQIEFNLDGEHFKRIPEVLDCWFESGSMPFAQLHYPFENKAKFDENYPADFIVEYVGQVRAWFYYVHVINTALFGDNAYKNVITTGVVAGNDGRKMSKSLGNFTDPTVVMDTYSADALRFLLLSSPLLNGEDFSLQDKDVSDTQRRLAMLWNMYDFFALYASIDNWSPSSSIEEPPSRRDAATWGSQNRLDQWILSRLGQLQADLTQNMQAYNIPDALSGVLPFLDDASNWFVRRSRRRFWKSESDADKASAYDTLYTVLRTLALILAPFTPFLAEELWHNLGEQGSVHLQDWPKTLSVNQQVLDDMATARNIIEQALALRANQHDEFGLVKIRQPLASLVYGTQKLPDFYEQIIADETNIKNIIHRAGENVSIDKRLTKELEAEGAMREIIRAIQGLRKSSGLEVDDHIKLSITGIDLAPELIETIAKETLADELMTGDYLHSQLVQINDTKIVISLERV
ncbi:MAG: isoleucine--tRNA ligase [Candidatus Nomurabacteria bacterium]|jgi:isoleucyl-tRNA synthetase|nr:isoleucine--tRNA ligase [Candidatus Nomurabacteria bacterium]